MIMYLGVFLSSSCADIHNILAGKLHMSKSMLVMLNLVGGRRIVFLQVGCRRTIVKFDSKGIVPW